MLRHRGGLLAALILAATVLFVVGVSIERSDGEHHAEGGQPAEIEHHAEGESEGGEEDHDEATAVPRAETGEEGEETVLGIETESTALVALAAVGSLLLALSVWMRPDSGPLLVFVALATLAFAVLDIAEISHLLENGEGGLVVVASLVALLHLAASAVAVAMRQRGVGGRGPASSGPPGTIVP